MLGVDKRTIRRMVASKRLRSYPTASGQHRFRLQDVEALAGRANPGENAPTPRGSSSITQAMREEVEQLRLEAEKRQAKKRIAEMDAETAKEGRAQRDAEVEQRAQAKRAEQEDRERKKYRTQAERWSEEYIPEAAPPTLKVQFRQTVKRTLDEYELLNGVPDAVMDAIEAAAAEIFGPWEQERQAQERAAEREHQAQARAAWLAQVNQNAVAAGVHVVRSHLRERHRQGLLSPSLDSQDVELLADIGESKVREYLEAEACKRELTEDEAKQLARDFIDTDYQLI